MSNDTSQVPTARLNVKPRSLLMIVGGGLVVGALIVVGAVMPAEYNVDPLGLGKLSGIGRIWAPPEKQWEPGEGMAASYSAATPAITTVIDIPLGAAEWSEAALEYKFAMTTGQALLYRWEAFNEDGTPVSIPVEFEFHGHTLAADGEEMTVAEYRKDRAASDQGALMAPFEGIHGWYFRNHSPDPIRIRLQATGFYALVPPGEPGNEFRLRPTDTEAVENSGDEK